MGVCEIFLGVLDCLLQYEVDLSLLRHGTKSRSVTTLVPRQSLVARGILFCSYRPAFVRYICFPLSLYASGGKRHIQMCSSSLSIYTAVAMSIPICPIPSLEYMSVVASSPSLLPSIGSLTVTAITTL